jgi:heme-degrading monooxygenase HmoA
MLAVVYQFEVKEGREKDFLESWRVVTEAVYKFKGSLGSRLHRNIDGTYIAYAQWPSRQQFENEASLPESTTEPRQRMKDACLKITTLFQAEMVADLLKGNPSDSMG